MCKIVVISHIKAGLEDKALQFAATITPIICKNDKDGMGYAALGDDGIFGERWLDPNDAWHVRDSGSQGKLGTLEKAYGGVLIGKRNYNTFGVRSKRVYSMMLHARMATCDVNIENTHPFVSRDGLTALIHNGVISNASKFDLVQSSCDSEAVLIRYEGSKVHKGLDLLQDAIEPLQGSYAVAAYSYNNGAWNLDLFKNSHTSLHAAFIVELDTVVFCTKADMIESAVKALGWTISAKFDVMSDTGVRLDALTGEVTDTCVIEPCKVTKLSSYNGGSAFEDYPINSDDVAELEDYDDGDYDFNDPFDVRVRRGA